MKSPPSEPHRGQSPHQPAGAGGADGGPDHFARDFASSAGVTPAMGWFMRISLAGKRQPFKEQQAKSKRALRRLDRKAAWGRIGTALAPQTVQ